MKRLSTYLWSAIIACVPIAAMADIGTLPAVQACTTKAASFDVLKDVLILDEGWQKAERSDLDEADFERLAWLLMTNHFLGNIPVERGKRGLALNVRNISGIFRKKDLSGHKSLILWLENIDGRDWAIVNWTQFENGLTSITCKVAYSSKTILDNFGAQAVPWPTVEQSSPDIASYRANMNVPDSRMANASLSVLNPAKIRTNGISTHAPDVILNTFLSFVSQE